jgi:hypothetical protein
MFTPPFALDCKLMKSQLLYLRIEYRPAHSLSRRTELIQSTTVQRLKVSDLSEPNLEQR